jgi:hypothetical protein
MPRYAVIHHEDGTDSRGTWNLSEGVSPVIIDSRATLTTRNREMHEPAGANWATCRGIGIQECMSARKVHC